jgi:hypothetical protein
MCTGPESSTATRAPDADFEPGSNFEQAQPDLADGGTLQAREVLIK